MISTLAVLKNSLTQNIVLKTISLIIGYGIWISLAQSHTTNVWLTIPLCFYGTKKHIDAPDSISVHITGRRHHLSLIDTQSLAVHINTDSLHTGPNPIVVENSNLFLPDTINVLHWSPLNVTVTILEDHIHHSSETPS